MQHQVPTPARVFSFPLDGGRSGRGWPGSALSPPPTCPFTQQGDPESRSVQKIRPPHQLTGSPAYPLLRTVIRVREPCPERPSGAAYQLNSSPAHLLTRSTAKQLNSSFLGGDPVHDRSWAVSIPASIRPHPTIPRRPSTSSRMIQPATAANTASRLRITAAWTGGACRWATTCSV